MQIKAIFDPATWTLTYIVWEETTKDAVIIDPVLDYDSRNVAFSFESADQVLAFVHQNDLRVRAVMDTHVHADHMSAMDYLATKLEAKRVVGSAIKGVQGFFAQIFDKGPDYHADGSQFDVLAEDGQVLEFGALSIRAIHTPGHTPADVTYQIGDALFTGDTMFMPDFGTGRCDFPDGSAEQLYDSITQKLYTLPDSTRVFVGHDYQPGGRELAYETTIGECKRSNKQLQGDTPREQFVTWRKERDAQLQLPNLIFQAIQINIEAGRLPDPQGPAGLRYLKMPLNVFT